jgi:hypothetical protein
MLDPSALVEVLQHETVALRWQVARLEEQRARFVGKTASLSPRRQGQPAQRTGGLH